MRYPVAWKISIDACLAASCLVDAMPARYATFSASCLACALPFSDPLLPA